MFQQASRLLNLLMVGFFLIMNGSVFGWCSKTNTFLLATSDCSASALATHQCDGCSSGCSKEVEEDSETPCNTTFSVELDDFSMDHRSAVEGSNTDLEQQEVEIIEQTQHQGVLVYSAHEIRGPPPPLRYLFCIYRL